MNCSGLWSKPHTTLGFTSSGKVGYCPHRLAIRKNCFIHIKGPIRVPSIPDPLVYIYIYIYRLYYMCVCVQITVVASGLHLHRKHCTPNPQPGLLKGCFGLSARTQKLSVGFLRKVSNLGEDCSGPFKGLMLVV